MGSKSEDWDGFKIWYFAVSSLFPTKSNSPKSDNISCWFKISTLKLQTTKILIRHRYNAFWLGIVRTMSQLRVQFLNFQKLICQCVIKHVCWKLKYDHRLSNLSWNRNFSRFLGAIKFKLRFFSNHSRLKERKTKLSVFWYTCFWHITGKTFLPEVLPLAIIFLKGHWNIFLWDGFYAYEAKL